MQTRAKKYLTPEEYLAIERAAEYKSEYFGGEMFPLAGTRRPGSAMTVDRELHNVIVANIASELSDRSCKVYLSDVRIASSFDLDTHPDVVAVWGDPVFDDGLRTALLNPTLIFEVLSPATEAYDRGAKFEHYRRIESLREYVLVAQDHAHVERYQRLEDARWLLSDVNGLDSVLLLDSIGCELPLAEIYHKVDFPGHYPDVGPAS